MQLGAPSDKRTTVKLLLSAQPATITCWPRKLPETTLPDAPISLPGPQGRTGRILGFGSVSEKIPDTSKLVPPIPNGIREPLNAPSPLDVEPEKKAATATEPVPAEPDPPVGAVNEYSLGLNIAALTGVIPVREIENARILRRTPRSIGLRINLARVPYTIGRSRFNNCPKSSIQEDSARYFGSSTACSFAESFHVSVSTLLLVMLPIRSSPLQVVACHVLASLGIFSQP